MMKLFKKPSTKAAHSDELPVKLSEEFVKEEEAKRMELKGCAFADFEVKKTLGTGSFGRVRLVKHKKSGRVYALKMLSKALVLRTKQLDHVLCEKEVLEALSFPFIVNVIPSEANFSRTCGRQTDSQMILQGSHLQLIRGQLRSLIIPQPENLLLDANGHLKVCDFGFAKTVEPGTNTWTLCGTPEYLAPEIILNKGHGKAVDWWALGVLIFEMLAGYPPFYAEDRMQLYQSILAGKIDYPRHIKKEAKDLISRLLTSDLSRRLGNLKGGALDIRTHAWFKGFDWEALINRSMPAPITINVRSADDASMFDDYDDDDGPDIGAGKVRPDQQQLFAGF
eukprot:767945-Hanusia_phi.AAC.3